jgi:P27 family predicted phage terminase small subunit
VGQRGTSPPPGLTEDERRAFLAVRAHLREQATWQESDTAALVRYVRALRRAADARAELDRHGSQIAEGPGGRPVPHPAVRIERDAEHDAAEYARDLLLTPAARRRAGISETSDADAELADLLR